MVNLRFKWTGNRKATTTGVWGRISVLALSLVCVVACQQATREVPAQEDAGTTQAVSSAEHKVEAPVHEVPAGEGVFARSPAAGKSGEDRTQKFTAIKTGRKNLLLATNAERGFGFAFPTGTVIPGNVRDFTLKLDGVRPEFLQITQYRGVAAPTPHPLDPPDDTNTAWIPTRAIPIDVQEYEDFIDIHLEAPLQPGFYVLHDDSLMRARHNEDVTFYHPFRVMASGSVSPWDVDSERCFADLVPRLSGGKALSREVRERLQACATAQRLSWKLHLDDRTDHSAMRMLYLARFLAPDDAVVQRQLNAATTKPQNEIELEIYRVAQEDQIERLDAIYAQLQGGGEPDEATMRAAVRFIRPESQDVGLRSLLWIPFWRVAPGDEALGRLFDAVVEGRDWRAELVEWLGALQVRDLTETVQSNRKLSEWYKEYAPQIPKRFVHRANALVPREPSGRVAVGPARFEGVSDAEIPSWNAALSHLREAVLACAREAQLPRGATFVLDLPLNGPQLQGVTRGVIKDPVDTERVVPAITPAAVACILATKFPSIPSLETTQRVKVALTFDEENTR